MKKLIERALREALGFREGKKKKSRGGVFLKGRQKEKEELTELAQKEKKKRGRERDVESLRVLVERESPKSRREEN